MFKHFVPMLSFVSMLFQYSAAHFLPPVEYCRILESIGNIARRWFQAIRLSFFQDIVSFHQFYYLLLQSRTIALHYFHKQPVYKKLALGWQIAMQLSGLNPLSPSKNKNYRLKKHKINVKQLLNRKYTKIQLSQKQYWENFNVIDHKYQF